MGSEGRDPHALDDATNELVETLHALTNQISQTSKDYKDPSGQQGLLLRQRMTNAARQIINIIREPGETPYEFSSHMAEMGAIRMFMKMKAFDKIPLEGSISYEDLADSLGAEVPLITRMAWMMVATGFLHQIGEDRVSHSRLSKLYVSGNAQGVFFQIMFDEAMVPWVQWPQFFAKYGLKEPTLGNHNPHSFAWGDEDKNFWEVISKYPERQVDFNQSMNTLDEVLPVTGMYDFSWIAKAEGPEDRPLIVDVGGGKGQALKRIMAAFPEIPAKRLVLQDRASVIEEVIQAKEPGFEEVKKIPHDFFLPNPVKGALVYYIRRCMHDWSDENDRIILSHLAEAMAPDSRILITEQVMPNPPTALNAWTDLCMMNLGGKERTEKMFDALTASAGLKMVGVHKSLATDVAVIDEILDDFIPPETLVEERTRHFAFVKPRSIDKDGDTEVLDGVKFTHHFVDAPGDHEYVQFHYVEAGPQEGEGIVFLHGIPDSWCQWHHQMAALSTKHRCIPPDLKGYGQSEKKAGDYRHEGAADNLYALLEIIGVTSTRFNIVSHDRGTVQADYIVVKHPNVVLRYGRGEQHLFHYNPVLAPQGELFKDAPWTGLMEDPKRFVVWVYTWVAKLPIPDNEFERIIQEYSYAGIVRAVPRYFNSSTFRAEWLDRRNRLLKAWKCPVMIMQGFDSRTQPREFYENARDYIPSATEVLVRYISGGHFWTMESPQETTEAIKDLLSIPVQNDPLQTSNKAA